MPKMLDSNGQKVFYVPVLIRFTKIQHSALLAMCHASNKSINELVRGMADNGIATFQSLTNHNPITAE